MDKQKRVKKHFTPEQKANIVQSVDRDVKSGIRLVDSIEKHGVGYSSYGKWKRQLEIGIKSSLRNGRGVVDKEVKSLRREIELLKEIVLSQSAVIAQIKKETNWA